MSGDWRIRVGHARNWWIEFVGCRSSYVPFYGSIFQALMVKVATENILITRVQNVENNWKIQKVARHSMQNLCSRICSFPPSIPAYYIRRFSKEGDIIFDMWSGKGSVPFEALRNNRIGIGNDKSPEAFIMTHAKVKPITFPMLKEFLQQLKRKMDVVTNYKELNDLDRKASIFYSKNTFEQILKLRKVLLEDESTEAIFTKAIIFGLLHGNGSQVFSLRCSHSYSMSPTYVKKYAKEHHLRRPSRNVLECILKKGESLFKDPLPPITGEAFNDDSTNIRLNDNYVNMILTSPPYFDTQTYAWCNWLRLWFLGHDYRDIRKTLAESGSIARYREFMKKSISEMYRVLKPGGRCFVVVGDVNACRNTKKVNTAKFLSPLFEEAKFNIEGIVVDKIPSGRRVMTYIPKDKGIKTERIIYLRKPS